MRIFCNLDEKLNNLDAMYTNRRDDLTSMQHLSTEEKLLLFQKNIELRTRESLKQQVNRNIHFLNLEVCTNKYSQKK